MRFDYDKIMNKIKHGLLTYLYYIVKLIECTIESQELSLN